MAGLLRINLSLVNLQSTGLGTGFFGCAGSSLLYALSSFSEQGDSLVAVNRLLAAVVFLL